MGYNLKALHYCGTHTHIFLKQNCKNCGQGMCRQCIENHEHFCPECIVELNMQTSGYKAKYKVGYSTLAGVISILGYLGYLYFDSTLNQIVHPWWYGCIAFGLGISVVATFYLLRYSEEYRVISRLPFVGFKLTLILPILLALSFIPVFFYISWLFLMLFSGGKKNKKF